MGKKLVRIFSSILGLFVFVGCAQSSKLSGSLTTASSSSASSQSVSCSLNGQTVPDGQSVSVFTAQSVPYGSSCSSVAQTITCSNGAFPTGVYYPSCTVAAPAACSFNSQSILSGSSVTAYQSSSVAYGDTCVSQSRTCTNGVLSGTYTFGSCAVGQPASCTFNSQTIANGGTVSVYTTQTVAYGSSCSSVAETITCTNGSFSPSGTYYPSCTVAAPASCTFNGQTVASGSSVAAYQNPSVPNGQACVSQARICTNGSLSGTYTYASCTVTAPTPVPTTVPTPAPTPLRVQVIQATAAASGGATITQVQFYVAAAGGSPALVCTVTAPTSGNIYSCNWTVPAGAGISYSLTTVATDSNGKTSTSAAVNVASQ